LKTYLADDENFNGKYIHGSRFCRILNVGGMEYERWHDVQFRIVRHETFPQLVGAGRQTGEPADGWWDEAWTGISRQWRRPVH